MIEQCGRIVALTPPLATIRIERKSACQTCASGNGCGSNSLRWFGTQDYVVSVRVEPQQFCGLNEKDEVVIGLPENGLLIASLLLYGLPLLCLLSVALLAEFLGANSWQVVTCSIFAGAIGIGLARQLQKTFVLQLQPVLLRKQHVGIAIQTVLT